MSLVQQAIPGTFTGTISGSASWPNPTTAGNLLVAVVSLGLSVNASGIVSAAPSGWVLAASRSTTNGTFTYIYYIPNAASRSGSESFTLDQVNDVVVFLYEESGILAASPLDQTAFDNGNVSNPTTGTTATTAQANEVCYGAISNRNTTAQTSPTNSFVQIDQAQSTHTTGSNRVNGGVYRRQVSATGTYGCGVTLSTSRPSSGVIATFKIATTTPVSSDLDLRYRIRNSIFSELDLRYQILGAVPVNSDLDLRYRIRNIITSQLDIRYQVLSTLLPVTSDLNLSWRIFSAQVLTSLAKMSNLETVSAAIESSTTRVTRRIEIYESDGATLWTEVGDAERLIDGSVTVDYDRDERRAFDLTLDNSDGLLRHDPYNGLWYDKIIKVYRGVRTATWEYETQIGEFMIDRIDEAHFPRHIHITGRDYSKKMLLSKLEKSTTFVAGTSISQIVNALAANSGVFNTLINTLGQVLGSDIPIERGTTRWQAAKDICTAYSLEIFFNARGILIVRPFRDPVTSPVAQKLRTGLDGNLVSYSKSANDSRLYNVVVAVGDDQDSIAAGVLIYGEARNTEPSSPTRLQTPGEPGGLTPRTLHVVSSVFATSAQAQKYCDDIIKVAALEEYELAFSSLVYPWWEVGEIVEFEDPRRGVDEPSRFLLTNLSFPMAPGPGDGTAKRVTIVGTGSTPGLSIFAQENEIPEEEII